MQARPSGRSDVQRFSSDVSFRRLGRSFGLLRTPAMDCGGDGSSGGYTAPLRLLLPIQHACSQHPIWLRTFTPPGVLFTALPHCLRAPTTLLHRSGCWCSPDCTHAGRTVFTAYPPVAAHYTTPPLATTFFMRTCYTYTRLPPTPLTGFHTYSPAATTTPSPHMCWDTHATANRTAWTLPRRAAPAPAG